MRLSSLNESADRQPIVKFVDGPAHDFRRIPGYCSYWSRIIKPFPIGDRQRPGQLAELASEYGIDPGRPLICPPFDGNLYLVDYDGPLGPAPLGITDTHGYPGGPGNRLDSTQINQLQSAYRAGGYRAAEELYSGWAARQGWASSDLKRDVLRSVPALYSPESTEIIINVECRHVFIAGPDIPEINGYYLDRLSDRLQL